MIPFEIQPHEILGVSKSATLEEAQAAFKVLARAVHPDMVPNNQAGATALFKLLNFSLDTIKKGGSWPASIQQQIPKTSPKDPKLWGWKMNYNRNWVYKKGKYSITVYFKNNVWKWIANIENIDVPTFCDHAFLSHIEAIEDVMHEFKLQQ